MAAMARQGQPPHELAGTGRGAPTYRLDDGHYAEHGRHRGAPAANATLLLEGGRIAVFPGDFARAVASAAGATEIGPVYISSDGVMAVPTGLVFVRFAEGTSAEARRADVERAGFALVQVPGYAPHAAWVRARSGGIAASLDQLAQLRTIAGTESIEPQMLMERVVR